MFAVIHTLCQLPLGGLEWRSIHSSSIDRESAAVVEWTLYQRSTEDDSQKTEPSLKDLIISVQTHLPPLGFRSWTSSRCWQLVKSETCEKLHIVCIESYLYVFLFVFEENQVVDEIIVILDVKSLKQRVPGDFPRFFHPSGQEGCMGLWPLIWGFWWYLSSKVILNLVDAHLP